MGLSGGNTGAKASLKATFSAAFTECSTLEQVREGAELGKSRTLVVMDGNVMAMGVPESVRLYSEYVGFLRMQILRAFDAGRHIVVVFDEPQALTRAKAEEQRRRDASRKKQTPVVSSDLDRTPSNDDWTTEQLEDEAVDLRKLLNTRAARSRFYDAFAVDLAAQFRERAGNSRACGYDLGSVTFDGVDARGGERPFGERRRPGILGTDDAIAARFERSVPVGEGDMKLLEVAERVQELRLQDDDCFRSIELVLLHTVDTDSLAIELIAQSKRNLAFGPKMQTMLCLRENAKRGRGDEPKPGRYTVVNVGVLQFLVTKHMLGEEAENPQLALLANTLLVAGIILCGTDFVELKGTRVDLMMAVCRDLCRDASRRSLLLAMSAAASGDEGQLLKMAPTLQELLAGLHGRLAKVPRVRKTSLASVQNYDRDVVLKTLWNLAYWNRHEMTDLQKWGFGG